MSSLIEQGGIGQHRATFQNLQKRGALFSAHCAITYLKKVSVCFNHSSRPVIFIFEMSPKLRVLLLLLAGASTWAAQRTAKLGNKPARDPKGKQIVKKE